MSDGTDVFIEQISHHPPVSAFHMEGPGEGGGVVQTKQMQPFMPNPACLYAGTPGPYCLHCCCFLHEWALSEIPAPCFSPLLPGHAYKLCGVSQPHVALVLKYVLRNPSGCASELLGMRHGGQSQLNKQLEPESLAGRSLALRVQVTCQGVPVYRVSRWVQNRHGIPRVRILGEHPCQYLAWEPRNAGPEWCNPQSRAMFASTSAGACTMVVKELQGLEK
eukprot:1136487-Pelagomonas_calceolata.AAC.1